MQENGPTMSSDSARVTTFVGCANVEKALSERGHYFAGLKLDCCVLNKLNGVAISRQPHLITQPV